MSEARARPGLVHLAGDLGSIRRARDHVRHACADAGLVGRTAETAVLLTSEVVTNALVHARSAPRLGVTTDAAGLRVEVGDDAPGPLGPVVDADPGAHSGRGLALVDLLADDWGVRAGGTGKVVWFSLSR